MAGLARAALVGLLFVIVGLRLRQRQGREVRGWRHLGRWGMQGAVHVLQGLGLLQPQRERRGREGIDDSTLHSHAKRQCVQVRFRD
eukprot:CAMPEP_0204573276 /NCGR_PEP_ID=MMETSP0661-20131031/39926_1 /ASSEMBLY_ACC=CAM_ASM_000606 /TAXON_ID=109239 /ORGANISM="Alexandrium margalefi, Strain AMGDE01CS-322" /LENGTH=85 /DNA_ID=CAMNT_0051581683 /DNA_START=64 /DNA_END=321 /DNA_ORIENTATION=+